MMRASKAFWLSLIVVSALAFGTEAPAQANLLVNPGFEAGGGSYSGWTTFGSGPQISTPATDNIHRTGIAAAKLYGEFTGCPSNPQFTVGGAFQAFTTTAGLVYEFSGYSFVSSADAIPTMRGSGGSTRRRVRGCSRRRCDAAGVNSRRP